MFREVQAKEQRGERKLDVEEARIEMLKKDFLDEYNRTRSTNRNWRAQIGPHLFPPTFFIFPRKVIAVLFFFLFLFLHSSPSSRFPSIFLPSSNDRIKLKR